MKSKRGQTFYRRREELGKSERERERIFWDVSLKKVLQFFFERRRRRGLSRQRRLLIPPTNIWCGERDYVSFEKGDLKRYGGKHRLKYSTRPLDGNPFGRRLGRRRLGRRRRSIWQLLWLVPFDCTVNRSESFGSHLPPLPMSIPVHQVSNSDSTALLHFIR